MSKIKSKLLAAATAATMLASTMGGVVVSADATATMPTRASAIEAIERANDCWISRNKNHGRAFWDNAAYYTGCMEAYYTTGIEAYRNYATAWATQNAWKGATSTNKAEWGYGYDESAKGVLFGDWQICFQTYVDLYNIEVNESKGATADANKIARAREVMEYEMSTGKKEYWWWADSLYMVMPVMTKLYLATGNEQYLDKLTEFFTYARDEIPSSGGGGHGMFDTEYKLFFRDAGYMYPDGKKNRGGLTTNGIKDFWARGSGWVFAGLAKVLSDMPTDYKNRDLFLTTYQTMAEGVKATQMAEGYWSRSMADPDYAPGKETSGTAFFTYGLAWGINSGYLDRGTYLDTCLKGWDYLYNTALGADGTVGYVQPIGENATQSLNVGPNNTSNFGVGAFLLAACEISKLAGGVDGDIYPYVQKKMIGSIALEVDTPHIYDKGKICHIDESNHNIKSYINNGRTMVPVRGVAEHLGATVAWDDATKVITVVMGDRTVKMTLGSAEYSVNGENKVLDVVPEVVEGRTFIPLRAMAEAIGKQVYWSEAPNAAEGGRGLIIIGHKADPFFSCDAKAVELLRTMIGIPEVYPTRPAQPTKDFVVKVVMPTLSDANRIQADSIVASAEPELSQSHGATAASDGNFDENSRWAAQGSNVNIVFEYEQAKEIGQVSLTFWKVAQRTTNFKLEYTTDGSTWVTVFDGASTLGKDKEVFDINKSIKKFKVTGNGNSENDWFSLIEFCAFKPGVSAGTATATTPTTSTVSTTQANTATAATGTKVALSTANVKFSQEPESANPGRNCLDGSKGTVWASQGVGCTAVVDLGAAKTVSSVGVGFKLYEDDRIIPYSVEVSADGSAWSKVYSGKSVPKSDAMIYLDVNQSAKFVRFTFDGNTTSQWNSVSEIEVYTK